MAIYYFSIIINQGSKPCFSKLCRNVGIFRQKSALLGKSSHKQTEKVVVLFKLLYKNIQIL